MEYIKQNNHLELKNIINKKYFDNILIVAGKKSFFKSGAKNIIQSLVKKKNCKYFFKRQKLPEITDLKRLINIVLKHKIELIIAIGGGGVLDLAKSANVLTHETNLEKKIILGIYKASTRFCDLIAIPTTAGSGAEVTTNAVIYIKNNKFSIEDKSVKPNHSFLFPKLVVSNSNVTKFASAFDAMSQSIESILSVKSTSESIKYAKKSLKIFFLEYQNYCVSRDISSTYQMSLCAYYSGKAISISKTTAPHALSYPFTSYFNIPHGHAVSLTLNEFVKFNYDNFKKCIGNFNLLDRYNILFKIFHVRNINEFLFILNDIEKSFKLERNFQKLNKKIITNLELITDSVNEQRLKNNPIKIKKKDIYNILYSKI
jgi:alcohol dehydrogenase class IV